MAYGKIITLEGTDGTGKKTQTEAFVNRAKSEGYPVYTLSFPDYESKWGKKVKQYLRGELGSIRKEDITLVSWLYALDREEKKATIEYLLGEGSNIILDRYMESNFAHQGAKLQGEQRKDLIEWLRNLETKILEIPPSDIVIFLDLPVEHSLEAMKKRRELDIHESDKDHLNNAYETYKMLAAQNNWITISCLNQNGCRYRKEDLSEIIWNTAKPYLVNGKPGQIC